MDTTIRLKRYDNPEDLFSAYFGVPIDELRESMMGGVLEDGQDAPLMNFAEVENTVRSIGCYGFVDLENTIHFWADLTRADAATLIHMFAHEICHTKDPEDDSLAKELECEACGNYAAMAYTMVKNTLEGIQNGCTTYRSQGGVTQVSHP